MSREELITLIGIVAAIITALAVVGFFAFVRWSRREVLRRERDVELAEVLRKGSEEKHD
jgi:hypothetical protein